MQESETKKSLKSEVQNESKISQESLDIFDQMLFKSFSDEINSVSSTSSSTQFSEVDREFHHHSDSSDSISDNFDHVNVTDSSACFTDEPLIAEYDSDEDENNTCVSEH